MDATADLLRYLQQARDSVLAALEGLSEYDIRRPLTASGTNLLGIVKHLASMESGYLGDSVGRPLATPLPWVADESIWDGADMWATVEQTREDIVGCYLAACRHSDTSVEQLGLGAPAQVAWWPAERRDTTLGSLLVRVLEDTAQHAGHADIVRELIDGRSASDPDGVDAAYLARLREAAEAHRVS